MESTKYFSLKLGDDVENKMGAVLKLNEDGSLEDLMGFLKFTEVSGNKNLKRYEAKTNVDGEGNKLYGEENILGLMINEKGYFEAYRTVEKVHISKISKETAEKKMKNIKYLRKAVNFTG